MDDVKLQIVNKLCKDIKKELKKKKHDHYYIRTRLFSVSNHFDELVAQFYDNGDTFPEINSVIQLLADFNSINYIHRYTDCILHGINFVQSVYNVIYQADKEHKKVKQTFDQSEVK